MVYVGTKLCNWSACLPACLPACLHAHCRIWVPLLYSQRHRHHHWTNSVVMDKFMALMMNHNIQPETFMCMVPYPSLANLLLFSYRSSNYKIVKIVPSWVLIFNGNSKNQNLACLMDELDSGVHGSQALLSSSRRLSSCTYDPSEPCCLSLAVASKETTGEEWTEVLILGT